MVILNDADRKTECWAKIEQFLKERLDSLRRKNDTVSLSEQETALLRGEIREIKALLSVCEESQVKVGKEPNYN